MSKQPTKRQQLQARIKVLKSEGKVSKKFDARQKNVILEAEIALAELRPGIAPSAKSKKEAIFSEKVVSFKDAQDYAERKGYSLQYSANGFKLELYTGTTGRPEKFLLPSDVIRYVNKLVA